MYVFDYVQSKKLSFFSFLSGTRLMLHSLYRLHHCLHLNTSPLGSLGVWWLEQLPQKHAQQAGLESLQGIKLVTWPISWNFPPSICGQPTNHRKIHFYPVFWSRKYFLTQISIFTELFWLFQTATNLHGEKLDICNNITNLGLHILTTLINGHACSFFSKKKKSPLPL